MSFATWVMWTPARESRRIPSGASWTNMDNNGPQLDIDLVAETLVRFGGGDFSARVPRTGDGSSLDRLAFAVNLTLEELAARLDEPAQQVAELEKTGQELETINHQLIETQHRLRHLGKLAALGELSALLAHELNQPLTAVVGFASILYDQSQELSIGQIEIVQSILQGADQMQSIVHNLSRFSRDDAFELQRTNARVPLDAALTLFRHQFGRLGIFCDIQTTDGTPEVKIDSPLTQQVFINLLANARDALISSTRSLRRIDVVIAGEQRLVSYRFCDTGPGVPAELRQRVFEPFFTTKVVGTGTGLGLGLSRDIVERQGGTLDLEPRDEGACFVVRLPAAI